MIDRDEGTGLVAAIELRPVGDDQAPRYARSGDDGVFRIEGVPNGALDRRRVRAGLSVARAASSSRRAGASPSSRSSRGGTIEGRVLDGDGQADRGRDACAR